MPNVFLCAKAVAKHLKDGTPLAESGIPACYETSLDRLQRSHEDFLARWPEDKPLVKDES
jgi:hypothetical protein